MLKIYPQNGPHLPFCCCAGSDVATCALVDAFLANPCFYVTEVLGPACTELAVVEANARPNTGAVPQPCRYAFNCIYKIAKDSLSNNSLAQNSEKILSKI